jgi:putative ABC transport system permease protein
MPDGVPRVTQIAMDLRVLGAAATLSVVTGVLFGVLPAWQLSRPDLTTALKDGSRGAGTRAGRQRVRSVLVVAEVALAVVLLVGAALFIGSFMALMRIDPGFHVERVLTAQVFPRFQPGAPPRDSFTALTEIVERIAQAPGVIHAAVISCNLPLAGATCGTRMTVPGRELPDHGRISISAITPDYHQALRIPLRSGRFFTDTDRKDAPGVAIINESAAKKYFRGESPLGRSVTISKKERAIVGVVGDVHQSSLETEPREEVYLPIAQQSTFGAVLVIHTRGNPYTVLPAVKAAGLAVLPEVPLRNVQAMEELMARHVAQRRLTMLLLGLFGLLGLVIAAVGIYGVLGYVVSQRTREIGVRMALGATRGKVVGMVMTKACLLVTAGLLIGTVGAWYLSAAAESFLFRTQANDPRVFLVALMALGLAGLVASAIPARRAASVDPIVALRTE